MKHKKTYKNIKKMCKNKFYGNNTKFLIPKMRPYQSQTQKNVKNPVKINIFRNINHLTSFRHQLC